MALREGAALDILAGEANLIAFLQQRREGERLAERPVNTGAGLDHLAAIVEEPLHGAMDVEAFRHS